jgi:hypothetical protein
VAQPAHLFSDAWSLPNPLCPGLTTLSRQPRPASAHLHRPSPSLSIDLISAYAHR